MEKKGSKIRRKLGYRNCPLPPIEHQEVTMEYPETKWKKKGSNPEMSDLPPAHERPTSNLLPTWTRNQNVCEESGTSAIKTVSNPPSRSSKWLGYQNCPLLPIEHPEVQWNIPKQNGKKKVQIPRRRTCLPRMSAQRPICC
jgi:hypothetical protein